MQLELSKRELTIYIDRQLSNFFGPGNDVESYLDRTLERLNKCFMVNKNKYYHKSDGTVFFSPYHSGQYSIFLYYLANTVYCASGDAILATKLYYLNKIMHSVDWYYEIELPDYWGIEHPVGSVLGRAKYSNGFFIYQGCTVGGNNGKYPEFGENVILFSNASVLWKFTNWKQCRNFYRYYC